MRHKILGGLAVTSALLFSGSANAQYYGYHHHHPHHHHYGGWYNPGGWNGGWGANGGSFVVNDGGIAGPGVYQSGGQAYIIPDEYKGYGAGTLINYGGINYVIGSDGYMYIQ